MCIPGGERTGPCRYRLDRALRHRHIQTMTVVVGAAVEQVSVSRKDPGQWFGTAARNSSAGLTHGSCCDHRSAARSPTMDVRFSLLPHTLNACVKGDSKRGYHVAIADWPPSEVVMRPASAPRARRAQTRRCCPSCPKAAGHWADTDCKCHLGRSHGQTQARTIPEDGANPCVNPGGRPGQGSGGIA